MILTIFSCAYLPDMYIVNVCSTVVNILYCAVGFVHWVQGYFSIQVIQQISDLQTFFSFHRLSFHFNDGFFYCAQGIEFDAVPLVYFAVLSSAFDDWVVWVAYILESNPLSVVLFAVIFSHSYQKTQTGWMDTKIRPTYMLSIKDPLQSLRHIQTESERMKKIFHANRNQKKARLAILISEKIDLKMKTIIRDKEGH